MNSRSKRKSSRRTIATTLSPALSLLATAVLMMMVLSKTMSDAFTASSYCGIPLSSKKSVLALLHMSSPSNGGDGDWQNNEKGSDSSTWKSIDDNYDQLEDWQDVMSRKNDGSFWSDFEPSDDATMDSLLTDSSSRSGDDEDTVDADAEAWLDALASISAEEVEFNMNEAKRADKAREMAEWGFDSETIKNTFGVAVDDTLEKEDEGMKAFRQESYWDDDDWKIVESHTKVEKDPDTDEPVRQQMVYVDEHTCIGCTNCAMVAQSTFFMNDEHGRARVFQQWGDDDETIQVAIETCPVDCIHYVPYDELVRLEIERRDQNINFKARLVSQAENGNALSHRVGGANRFTAPQKISGNMGSRCNNCPSRGCKDCPMFGVGKNPEFERKEKERKERIERRKLAQQREEQKKSVDL